jgi:8-oxo-dGTP pyrophosphatase MutT (NUDIX family)
MDTIYSAGLIPLRKNQGTHEVLLLRCFNYWDFPKGEVDPGEDFLQAALRELKEETDLVLEEILPEKNFIETEKYSKGKIARYYAGYVKEGPVKISSEHHQFKWFKYDDARKILVPRLVRVLDWGFTDLSK